jgi:hypothetical protein
VKQSTIILRDKKKRRGQDNDRRNITPSHGDKRSTSSLWREAASRESRNSNKCSPAPQRPQITMAICNHERRRRSCWIIYTNSRSTCDAGASLWSVGSSHARQRRRSGGTIPKKILHSCGVRSRRGKRQKQEAHPEIPTNTEFMESLQISELSFSFGRLVLSFATPSESMNLALKGLFVSKVSRVLSIPIPSESINLALKSQIHNTYFEYCTFKLEVLSISYIPSNKQIPLPRSKLAGKSPHHEFGGSWT